MSADPAPQKNAKIALPDIPALTLNAKSAYMLTDEGELKTLSHDQAAALVHKKPLLVCHAPYTRGRLGKDAVFFPFDVLELFAFVHPGTFATPTVNGLCKALGLIEPESIDESPVALVDVARALLSDLQNDPHKAKADPIEIARVMGLNGKGWGWTPFIFSALGEEYDEAVSINAKSGLAVWKNLPEWTEDPPEPPASHHAVTGDEARERLQKLLGHGAEKREEQMAYATSVTAAFAPTENANEPRVVLAEAGTGVGKTLGYLAPASVWAEKNQGTVWVSTYTKNLQRQIDQELDRLYPEAELKDAHVATRKGRENYLCLLNLEEAAAGAALAKHPDAAIAAGIMARWTVATKDGDLTGGQYPGWLSGILGYRHSTGLSDRRGECVYSACDHYHTCFVEHSVRKAKRARLVVANHALVMINSAIATPGEDMPSRYVFDEGHHLFDAADSAYAAHLSARETRDLRRWILGNEGGRRQSRARGLKRRAEDLAEGMAEAEEALRKIVNAAEALPLDGWTRRLKEGTPSGPTELFMAEIYRQVFARADGRDGPYSLETQVFPVEESLLERARTLKSALKKLQKPMQDLERIFHKKLAEDEGYLEADTRKRLEAMCSSLERRSALTLQAWILMLENLDKGETPQNQSLPLPEGKVRMGRKQPETIQKAQELRKNTTEAEQKLWNKLNKKQLGVKFRQQHPLEPFIVDFACIEKRLIIEIDGGQHNEQKDYDEKRSKFLEAHGYRILRFWNNEVLQNIDGVLQQIEHALHAPPPNPPPVRGGQNNQFVDWFEIERVDGQAIDVGYYRHHVDPMIPFANSVRPHVHGMAVTSATLRDTADDAGWVHAMKRTGAAKLTPEVQTSAYSSPFNYAEQTKVFIINDVRKDDMALVAGAYKALFEASGGGALGLFTAISRLRAVHNRIAPSLEERGLPLYSQHVDEIDPGTLVDMFREDTHACLLGTDAIRDGVDVPGESLRLIVFDRVPWPRPTILHKARREAFGGREYDEMITRLKLKQAFGRLIRRAGDKGVFVMMDPMLPSRLQNAFPPEVEVIKQGLGETVQALKEFLK